MLTRAFKNYDGKCNITETEKNELSSVLSRYQGISVGLDGKLGRTNKVEHTINTGEKPIKLPPPPRRLPLAQRKSQKHIKGCTNLRLCLLALLIALPHSKD